MPRSSPRSDNSYMAQVKMLHVFGFDDADDAGIRYDSSKYRLIREPSNPVDPNAVVVYISQLKVGYLEWEVAADVAPEMDAGDVFSARHDHSKRSNYYNQKYDNDHGDGYYRDLHVQVYNESVIAIAKGKVITEEETARLRTLHIDPRLTNRNSEVASQGGKVSRTPATGCGCLVLGLISIGATIVSILK